MPSELNDNPELLFFQGVKFNSEFIKLKHFYVCNPGLPPSLGHDLFEGIVNFNVALVLKYLIKKRKLFTYTLLYRQLQQFEYKGKDVANKPQAT